MNYLAGTLNLNSNIINMNASKINFFNDLGSIKSINDSELYLECKKFRQLSKGDITINTWNYNNINIGTENNTQSINLGSKNSTNMCLKSNNIVLFGSKNITLDSEIVDISSTNYINLSSDNEIKLETNDKPIKIGCNNSNGDILIGTSNSSRNIELGSNRFTNLSLNSNNFNLLFDNNYRIQNNSIFLFDIKNNGDLTWNMQCADITIEDNIEIGSKKGNVILGINQKSNLQATFNDGIYDFANNYSLKSTDYTISSLNLMSILSKDYILNSDTSSLVSRNSKINMDDSISISSNNFKINIVESINFNSNIFNATPVNSFNVDSKTLIANLTESILLESKTLTANLTESVLLETKTLTSNSDNSLFNYSESLDLKGVKTQFKLSEDFKSILKTEGFNHISNGSILIDNTLGNINIGTIDNTDEINIGNLKTENTLISTQNLSIKTSDNILLNLEANSFDSDKFLKISTSNKGDFNSNINIDVDGFIAIDAIKGINIGNNLTESNINIGNEKFIKEILVGNLNSEKVNIDSKIIALESKNKIDLKNNLTKLSLLADAINLNSDLIRFESSDISTISINNDITVNSKNSINMGTSNTNLINLIGKKVNIETKNEISIELCSDNDLKDDTN